MPANADLLQRAQTFGDTFVRKAARTLRDLYGHTTSKEKGHFDVVTEADTRVEAEFKQTLQREFADHQMIGEESIADQTGVLRRYCWVIDPLDGTVNFASRYPSFAVSLAFLVEGQPTLAWVCDPMVNECFFAQLGAGASLNGQPLNVADHAGELLPVAISSSLVESSARDDAGQALLQISDAYGKIRLYGSQALQLCFVACGRLEANINMKANIWDDAAGCLIVREAGGIYSDFYGNEIFPVEAGQDFITGQSQCTLASLPKSHQPLCKMVEHLQPNPD